MIKRHPNSYRQLLKDQYGSLNDAVAGFYAGNDAKANDIAVRVRTLVHNTSRSHALLSFVAANYAELNIYHKSTTSKNAVFVMNQRIRLSGDGASEIVRDDFTSRDYALVPMEYWWTDEYLVIGTIRSSKKDIVLDVADKDGGAHVDPVVPARHAAASEPPFVYGVNHRFVRPNLARSTVAQAGNELLNYIERHFPNVVD